MPPVPKSVPRRQLRVKSAGKEETACVGSCEKSIKPASGEADEIRVLLRPDLLEDIDAHIQDFEGAISELCSAAYAKDEELIAAYK